MSIRPDPLIAPAKPRAGRLPGPGLRTVMGGILLALAIMASFYYDDAARQLALDHQHDRLRVVSQLMSTLANGRVVLPLCLGMLALSWWFYRPWWTRTALAALVSFALAGMTVNCLRFLTGRTRPGSETPAGWYGPRYRSEWVGLRHQFNSFPSGHTGAAGGLAGIFILGVRRYRLPAAAYVGLVGWARIYQDDHHLSDVVMGLIVGLVVAHFTWQKLMPSLLRLIPPRRARAAPHRASGP